MKMLRQSLLVICLVFTLSNLHATDKIEESFGLRLGNTFEPATAVSTNLPNHNIDLPPRELEYEVVHTNGIKPFDNLFVQITPKTHQIYRIIARGRSVTDAERKAVMAEYQGKFPANRKITRHLRVKSTQLGGDKASNDQITTELIYTALDLEKIALQEKAEEQSPK